MANAGADVDMIQLGNEINNGLFIQSYSNGTPSVSCQVSNSSSSNFTTVIDVAISAVRDYDEDIEIMLHLAYNYSSFSWSYAFISSLDFDVLGLSYYPFLSAHSTIANLERTIKSVVSSGKEVFIAATEANQKAVMVALFTEVKSAGGSGAFYWGGDWIANCSQSSYNSSYTASVAAGGNGIGSTWENQALFDISTSSHTALSVLEAFADNY